MAWAEIPEGQTLLQLAEMQHNLGLETSSPW